MLVDVAWCCLMLVDVGCFPGCFPGRRSIPKKKYLNNERLSNQGGDGLSMGLQTLHGHMVPQ
jgi:hypothetical protein